MQRFFLPNPATLGDKIVISDKSQVHYIKDVLRLKAKENVVVFDGQGNEYICIVEELLLESVIFHVKGKRKFVPAQKVKITIACAIPKKSKMDDIIDKLTQLGAQRIIPLLTERVVIKWDEKQKLLRQRRWEKIAISAAQQSQRNNLPVVGPIRAIKEVLAESENYDLKLIPTLYGKRKACKDILSNSTARNILILIGPEGDFSPAEINSAKQAGCIPVSLGDLVLRVETAALAITSYIKLTLTD